MCINTIYVIQSKFIINNFSKKHLFYILLIILKIIVGYIVTDKISYFNLINKSSVEVKKNWV